HRATRLEREAMPAADALHLHPVQLRRGRASRPAARNEIHPMSPSRDAAEQLVQMDLGSSGLRILPVVPVDQQDLHSAPVSRATVSRTPLMNAGAFAPANQCASFTASSITTRDGVTASSSSASASRRILRSMTATRSSRQGSAASLTRL